MLFMTTYTFRDDISQESVKEMLAIIVSREPSPTEKLHYIATDGSGGVVINEVDAESQHEVYEGVLHMQPYMEMHTRPILAVEDAMPTVMKVYG